MEQVPDNLKYSKEHEWVRIEGDIATIGVTDYAQEHLGDIVYVELPGLGEAVTSGETFGVLESVKAVSDCYAPVSGKVIEVNDSLTDSPETVNEDCYGEGWMVRIKMTELSELAKLLDHSAYSSHIAEESV